MDDGSPISPSREAASGSRGRHATPLPCLGQPTGNIDNLIRALQEQQSPPVASVKANETCSSGHRFDSLPGPPTTAEGRLTGAKCPESPEVPDETAGVGAISDSSRKRKNGAMTIASEVECDKGEGKEAASRELCLGTIEKALSENRIDAKKADRLRDCIDERNWADVSYRLLCEQIPKKRKGNSGYQCRVCLVPLKGHICPYCPVCSTAQIKYLKSESHNCVNCPACFHAGKRRKKVVQIRVEGHVCPNANATS
ncbi:hypothetical protein THAOC_15578 [Thalassiosira oceanica]|uniref:Uncharacterized protein n=1 Tax=Thalassiosira oceanica TaxID=159749 RepID=K0SEK0_THAOC|nr:hypothetical protein THAOC_15578 [Thalassiosira oceanica]|eukprot:EJK63745.1 hypothetical protein THAOC_15578 [Thalassiosira oceanica]